MSKTYTQEELDKEFSRIDKILITLEADKARLKAEIAKVRKRKDELNLISRNQYLLHEANELYKTK